VDLFKLHVHLSRDLLGQGLAPEVLQEPALDLLVFGNGFHHVHRNADGAGLIRERARDGLPDPPGGVGGELETAAVIEFLDRLEQAEVPLLNEVQKREVRRAADVALGDRNHQAQIRLGEFFPRLLVALFDPARKLLFLIPGNERDATDFPKIHLHRIARIHLALEVVAFAAAVVHGRGRGLGLEEIARFDDLDVRLLELHVEVLEEEDVVLDARECGEDLRIGNKTAGTAALRKFPDLPLNLGRCLLGGGPPLRFRGQGGGPYFGLPLRLLMGFRRGPQYGRSVRSFLFFHSRTDGLTDFLGDTAKLGEERMQAFGLAVRFGRVDIARENAHPATRPLAFELVHADADFALAIFGAFHPF